MRRAYDGGTARTLQGVQPLLQGFRRSVVPIIGRQEFNLFTENNKLKGTITPTIKVRKYLQTVTEPAYKSINVDKILIKKTRWKFITF